MKVKKSDLYTDFTQQIVYTNGCSITLIVNTETNNVFYRVRTGDSNHEGYYRELDVAINVLNEALKSKGWYKDIIELV